MSAHQSEGHSNVTMIVVGVLAVWLALVFMLGWQGSFVRPPGSPPLPILFGVTVPLLVFAGAFLWSRAFREFVLTVDLRLVTAIQAWRFAGLGFLALHTYGILPGGFAWPAGLGDIAIGLTAPWMMLALLRLPAFAGGPLFKAWNILGIADLVVAVGTGALVSGLATGAAGEITTAPMARLPLVVIPAFLVPISTMLHLTALFQAGEQRASERRQCLSSVEHRQAM
jgi:hypothetical protein